MKFPDANHPITITKAQGRVVVRMDGQVIADTRRALTLAEANYPTVEYIPRSDARMELLARSTHHSNCPYKGDATYYTLRARGAGAPSAVWSYMSSPIRNGRDRRISRLPPESGRCH